MGSHHSALVPFASVEPIQGFCGLVWELIDPGAGNSAGLSTALVEVNVGMEATLHLHRRTEEVYFILEGEGEVRLGAVSWKVGRWDSVLIRAGERHAIKNAGTAILRLLTINHPAYDPDDSVFDE